MPDHHISLLLVEDDPVHAEFMTAALREDRPHIHVDVVTTGNAMLDALSRSEYDGVILDYSLPDYDADRLLELADDLLNGCPTIIASCVDGQDVVIATIRRGAVDFVPKQQALRPGVLWARMSKAIASRRKQQRERRRSERRQRYLARLVETDDLTGLHNRRYVDRCIEQKRWTGDRRQHLSVVMLDVDLFKSVNDAHGHAVGDEVLRTLADTIKLHCAPSDVAVRWGGEEMLVIRPGASLEQAWAWAEQLRQDVAESPITTQAGPLYITISIGVADEVPDATIAEQIADADEALYLAKRSGRNMTRTTRCATIKHLVEAVDDGVDTTADERLRDLLRRLWDHLEPGHDAPHLAHASAAADVASNMAAALGLNDSAVAAVRDAALAVRLVGFLMPETDRREWRDLNDDQRHLLEEARGFVASTALSLGASEPAAAMILMYGDAHAAMPDRQGTSDRETAKLGSQCIALAYAYAARTGGLSPGDTRGFEEARIGLSRESPARYDQRAIDALLAVPPPYKQAA